MTKVVGTVVMLMMISLNSYALDFDLEIARNEKLTAELLDSLANKDRVKESKVSKEKEFKVLLVSVTKKK